MKKLVLAAILCIAASVVAPIASASASVEVTGKCELEGPAEFKEPGPLTKELKEVKYKFTSSKVTCETTPPSEEAKATVEGTTELSCTAGLGGLGGVGTAGTGKVEYLLTNEPAPKTVQKHTFTFKFQSVLNLVVFEAVGLPEVSAKGVATFPATAIEPCEKAGAKELSFTAKVLEKSKL